MRLVSRDGQVDPKGHRFPQDLRVPWNKTQTQSAAEPGVIHKNRQQFNSI